MSNGTTTVSELLQQESKTDFSMKRPFSAISEHSSVTGMPQHIREWLMSSRQDSPANHSASPESEPGQTITAICGPKLSQPFARYNPDSCSWRMCQGWLLADISAPSWETWPKAGLIVAGEFYPHPKWERRISEIDFGLWPTPRANKIGGYSSPGFRPTLEQAVRMWRTPSATDGERGGTVTENMDSMSLTQQVNTPHKWPTPRAHETIDLNKGNRPQNGADNLATAVTRLMTPTPSSNDWKGSSKAGQRRGQLTDPAMGVIQPGGKLNPTWVEWLMGFPLGWTDLKPLAMDRFQQWRQQHGES